jgi:hypothetical protein
VASYWADRACETAIELEALRSTAIIGLASLSLKLKCETPNAEVRHGGTTAPDLK